MKPNWMNKISAGLTLGAALLFVPGAASAQTTVELYSSNLELGQPQVLDWQGNLAPDYLGQPFNTYYHDQRAQSIYPAAALQQAGMVSGDVIDIVGLKPSSAPCQALSAARLATAWTSASDFSTASFEPTTVGFGPTPIAASAIGMYVGSYYDFDIVDMAAWDGISNLVVEFSNDNGSYCGSSSTSGGASVRSTPGYIGLLSDFSDSNAGSYPFSGMVPSSGDATEYVLSLQLTLASSAVDDDMDGYDTTVDCDDANAMVNPGMMEATCNSTDDDCDAATLDDPDVDMDGTSLCSGDCDDNDATVSPSATEVCDGLDNDCDGSVPADEADADMDGQSTCEGDCDDGEAANFMGNEEVCDGMDNDCSGDADFGAVMMGDDDDSAAGDDDDSAAGDDDDSAAGDDDDSAAVVDSLEDDEDGDGYLECGVDCDDWNAAINPAADELCDGLDNDCNGLNDFMYPMGDDDDDDSAAGDDDDSAMGDDDDSAMGDDDDSAMGDDDDSAMGDDSIEVDMDMDGFLLCADDCDDMSDTVYPGAPELCGDLDEDCDGLVGDDEIDGDGDGFTPCDGDCEDAFAEDYPGAPEICDGYDNDCDGELPADEADADSDGEAICDGDCDDAEASTNSVADEICDDGVDNDCDGDIDGDDVECDDVGDDDDAAGDDDDAADDDDDDDDDNGGSACDCSTLGQRDAAPVGMLLLLGLGLGVMRRRS